jgi:hypothetical protein
VAGVGPSVSVDLTVDDVIAYKVHALNSGPANRTRRRRRQLLAGLPLFMLLPILVITVVGQPSPFHVALLVVGLAVGGWVLFMPAVMVLRVPRLVGRLIGNGQFSAPTRSLLWIDEDAGIVNQSIDRTVSYAFTAIERVEETPEYVFVIVRPGQALIIPRRVDEPAVQAFLQALTWHRSRPNLPYPFQP